MADSRPDHPANQLCDFTLLIFIHCLVETFRLIRCPKKCTAIQFTLGVWLAWIYLRELGHLHCEAKVKLRDSSRGLRPSSILKDCREILTRPRLDSSSPAGSLCQPTIY